jgi:hypothetical protein
VLWNADAYVRVVYLYVHVHMYISLSYCVRSMYLRVCLTECVYIEVYIRGCDVCGQTHTCTDMLGACVHVRPLKHTTDCRRLLIADEAHFP